jgi:predicted negative regulator of RcsB-dependent stress response
MNKNKTFLIIAGAIALGAVSWWFYQKQRVKAIDSRVDNLEEAIKRLEEAKLNS